jgi:uncharacterized damage-inducible protein DinB
MEATINAPGLLALYTYNGYANRLVLDIVEQLDREQLEQRSSPSHESVFRLLLHILDCEAFFLSQCSGQPFAAEMIDLSSLCGVRSFWRSLEKEQTDYIAALSAADLGHAIQVQLRGQSYTFSVWQLLLQALVHSVHHRGELSIVLTGLGHPLPTLDILLHFIRESGQKWD